MGLETRSTLVLGYQFEQCYFTRHNLFLELSESDSYRKLAQSTDLGASAVQFEVPTRILLILTILSHIEY